MQKILLTLLCCTALVSCSSEKNEISSEQSTIPVIATQPSVRDIPTYIESIGTFYPSVTMEIHSQINGNLEEIFVSEGQWIEKDTPLIKIDSRSHEVRLLEAEAQIKMNQVDLEATQRKVDRFRKLAQRDLVAQIEWDEILTQADKAQSSLYLSEARLKAIKLDLENCLLKSPIQGRIGKIDVHPGTLITSAASPLLTISQLNPLLIEFNVTEAELAAIPNEHPTVEIQAMCGSSFGKPCATGSITFLDNHFDFKTGQLLVRGKVDNPAFQFRPGQIIKIKIPISISKDQMLIPQKAVRYNEQGTYVYTIDAENQVIIRQVVLGDEIGKEVIVKEGITLTDQIITDGHLRAHPGSKVEVQS